MLPSFWGQTLRPDPQHLLAETYTREPARFIP
jgi:hypothetical protein